MSATDLPVFVAASEHGLPEEALTREAFAVEVPAGTTNLGERAFRNCFKGLKVTLPPGLTRIGNHAFNNCHRLTQIALPTGITHIG